MLEPLCNFPRVTLWRISLVISGESNRHLNKKSVPLLLGQTSYIKLNTDTSILTCDIPLWLQSKLGSATHIMSWAKQTSCVYSNKATCFAFLKPSLGHQSINQGKYANIHSPIFFSSHDISYHCDQKVRWMLLLSAIQWEGRDLQYGMWRIET